METLILYRLLTFKIDKMLTSSVNVIIQLLILHACRMFLLLPHTPLDTYSLKIYTVTGLPLTTLLRLIRDYTHNPPKGGIMGIYKTNRYI